MTCSKVHQGTVGACLYCERDEARARLADEREKHQLLAEAYFEATQSWSRDLARLADAEQLIRETREYCDIDKLDAFLIGRTLVSDKLNWKNPAPDAAAAPSIGTIVQLTSAPYTPPPDAVIVSRCCPTCDALAARLVEVQDQMIRRNTELGAAQARLAEAERQRYSLRAALKNAVAISGEAWAHWDADHESKVGKILIALSGDLPGYDSRIDAIHAALRPADSADVCTCMGVCRASLDDEAALPDNCRAKRSTQTVTPVQEKP